MASWDTVVRDTPSAMPCGSEHTVLEVDAQPNVTYTPFYAELHAWPLHEGELPRNE